MIYEKCRAKLYSFLVNNTTLPSDNSLLFRQNLLEKILRIIMTIDEKSEIKN